MEHPSRLLKGQGNELIAHELGDASQVVARLYNTCTVLYNTCTLVVHSQPRTAPGPCPSLKFLSFQVACLTPAELKEDDLIADELGDAAQVLSAAPYFFSQRASSPP